MLLQLAAEASGPSKVPFYVAGGLLVLWAVVISAIGITVPDFPGSRMLGRVVLLLTVVLVAGAAATAMITS